MAYFINQIHVRTDDDNEIIRKIDELLYAYPGRWRTQSDVIRSSINYMHRALTKETTTNNGGVIIWEQKHQSANSD